jgi:type I restriction enzyme, S subunit
MKAGWGAKPLEECLDRLTVPAKIPRKKFQQSGPFRIISQEAEFINGYWGEEKDLCKLPNPVVVFGDHTQVKKYVDFDFVVGADGVKVLNPKDFLNAKFLLYFLEANPFPSLGYARHYRHVKSLPVPLPSLEEQKQIVAILDKAFAGLERARENAEANLKNARELFESYVEFSIRNDPTTSSIKTLPHIGQNLDSRRVPITKSARVSGDIPYYGASGIVDRVRDHIFDEDILLVSEDGANLLARTYPIAFSVTGKSWVNNHAHVIRFGDRDTQDFVELYLNSISLEPYVSGMAQPKLNQKALNSIPIPMPDRTKCKEIVSNCLEIKGESRKLSNNYERKITGLDQLKQSLLQKAFAGELT